MEVITLLLLTGTGLVVSQAHSSEVVQPYPMTVFILVLAVVVLLVVITLLLAFNLIEARKGQKEPSERQRGEVKKDNALVLAGKYKEVLNNELTTFADTFKDIPRKMRLFSLCMRTLYAEQALGTTSETAKKINKIRDDTRRYALVYVKGILPASTDVVRSIKDFFDVYDSLDFNEWREYLPSILEDVRVYRRYCQTLVRLHKEIMVPLKKTQDEVSILISELECLTEELKRKRKEFEKSASSKEKWAYLFLFIPEINVLVAPLLQLSALVDTYQAIESGQQSKMSELAIYVVNETLMPAISALVESLTAAAGFFKVVEIDIVSFEANKLKKRRNQQLHYNIMKKQAANIATNCREFYAMIPEVESDFKAIPEDSIDRNYVKRWRQKQQEHTVYEEREFGKDQGSVVALASTF